MGVAVVWVIIVIVLAIAANLKKQKEQEARRKQSQKNASARPAGKPSSSRPSANQRTAGSAQKTAAGRPASTPNVILERAKQNTRDVHSSHVERETESSRRGYGGGPLPEGSGTGQEKSEFGSPKIGPAASGIPENEKERIRKTKERLQKELLSEQNDANSKSGRNRIMEAAKENSLETRIGNLSDSSRDYMEEVRELMVKGPDDVLTDQRDFVAEGMAMINEALIG